MDLESEAGIAAVLAGYAAAGAEWIARSDGLSSDEIYQPVADLMPVHAARILDLGAATGRDAAWLVRKGHGVTAVEPVAELKQAGQRLHPEAGIDWVDDRLPMLERMGPKVFDCVLANGVLHHLNAVAQERAVARMAGLLARGGLLIAALRHGAGPKDRPVWPVDVAALVAVAQASGLDLTRLVETGSIQPQNQDLGVTWTWLALRRAAPQVRHL
ncbi:MAG: class I SAM-dependent methyltransferase [Hoeflea sp.]|nr:class I SAM-dependent methyltransferase [Hoeflea sp.]